MNPSGGGPGRSSPLDYSHPSIHTSQSQTQYGLHNTSQGSDSLLPSLAPLVGLNGSHSLNLNGPPPLDFGAPPSSSTAPAAAPATRASNPAWDRAVLAYLRERGYTAAVEALTKEAPFAGTQSIVEMAKDMVTLEPALEDLSKAYNPKETDPRWYVRRERGRDVLYDQSDV